MNVANPKSDFVTVNGIRLHYLDWGGVGPTLIFLTGKGYTTPERFPPNRLISSRLVVETHQQVP